MYRGCKNNKKKEAATASLQQRVDKLIEDSIRKEEELAENALTLEYADGQLSLSQIRVGVLEDSQVVLNDQITALRKRHVPITPNPDTNITTVPNQYINDCEGCFVALGKSQDLGLRYKAEADNRESLNLSKMNALNNRVKILELYNDQLSGDYRSVLDSLRKEKPSIRRTLYFSLGTMAIGQNLPNAVGAGFLYQDKKKRIFGVKYYIGKESIYQAEVAIPLSLRFK